MGKLVMSSHRCALTDLVTNITLAGLFAVITDLVWCIRDYILQNYPIDLLLVIICLTIAIIWIGYALMQYHMSLQQKLLKELLKDKLNNCKLKYKHVVK